MGGQNIAKHLFLFFFAENGLILSKSSTYYKHSKETWAQPWTQLSDQEQRWKTYCYIRLHSFADQGKEYQSHRDINNSTGNI